jgi:leader peptidase (prepilin peptidase)/N-methyltransferase
MTMMKLLALPLTAGFVCILSVSDCRTKTIPAWAAPIFGACMLLLHLLFSGLTLMQFLTGLIPGGILLLLSFLFHSQIGSGDGAVVLACGVALGFENTFAALTCALVLCAFFCTVLLILKKKRRSDTLPFLPFLAASHLILTVTHLVSCIRE